MKMFKNYLNELDVIDEASSSYKYIKEILKCHFYENKLCDSFLRELMYSKMFLEKLKSSISICSDKEAKLIYYHLYLYYKFSKDDESKKIFEQVFQKRDIYNGVIVESAYEFIIEYLKFKKEKKEIIDRCNINRFLCFDLKRNKVIIRYLVDTYEDLERVLPHDEECYIDKDKYIEYFINNLSSGELLRDMWPVIVNKNLLTYDDVKNIIDTIIKYTNALILIIKNKSINVRIIFQTSQLIENLNIMKKFGSNLTVGRKTFLTNIDYILRVFTFYKREFMADDDYLKQIMSEHEFEFPVENDKLKEYKDKYFENIDLNILRNIIIDLDKKIMEASSKIDIYDLVSHCTIDSTEATYMNDPIEYPLEIQEYVETKLINKNRLTTIMRKIINKKIPFQDGISFIFMLDKDEEILKHIDKKYNGAYINDYVFIAERIIEIEIVIDEIVLNLHPDYVDKPMSDKVLLLFKKYHDDSYLKNLLFTIYVYIYDENGYNLRNRVMHGNALKDDIKKNKITVYGLVILVYQIKNLLLEGKI